MCRWAGGVGAVGDIGDAVGGTISAVGFIIRHNSPLCSASVAISSVGNARILSPKTKTVRFVEKESD